MKTRQYKDVAGNPCSLDWLVKNEPEWAANQIRHRDKLEAELNELESALAEYSKVPCEVCIGTDSPVDKVRWLARRCDGDDRTISRLHRENADLKTLIGELSQLVWEHHSSTIMLPNVCPACSEEKWSKVLDTATGVKSANNEVRHGGPDATNETAG